MPKLRAVTFDAAGTLIDVAEPVGETYARFAARHGIAIAAADVERGFRSAFANAPPLAFPGASPVRLADHERAWWYALVRRAFGAAAASPAFDTCFDVLFAHYAGAAAWHVFPEVPEALRGLRARGLHLAVVSNFDGRLVPLLGALGIATLVDRIVHSTRAGAAKPDPRIFANALAALAVPAGAALHVGDRVEADVDGARAAGMRAALLDRTGKRPAPAGAVAVASLRDLIALAEAE